MLVTQRRLDPALRIFVSLRLPASPLLCGCSMDPALKKPRTEPRSGRIRDREETALDADDKPPAKKQCQPFVFGTGTITWPPALGQSSGSQPDMTAAGHTALVAGELFGVSRDGRVEYYCECCDMWLNGPVQLADHKKGKKHRKNSGLSRQPAPAC